MKKALIFAAAILGFFSLAEIYSTVKGYTVWYFRSRHSEIFVDGCQVSGYFHESKRSLIATRRDTTKPHSYLISWNENAATVFDCGDWSAPRFFVFAIGDVNPPCLTTIGDAAVYTAPEAPAGPVKTIGTTMTFRTRDGKQIRLER